MNNKEYGMKKDARLQRIAAFLSNGESHPLKGADTSKRAMPLDTNESTPMTDERLDKLASVMTFEAWLVQARELHPSIDEGTLKGLYNQYRDRRSLDSDSLVRIADALEGLKALGGRVMVNPDNVKESTSTVTTDVKKMAALSTMTPTEYGSLIDGQGGEVITMDSLKNLATDLAYGDWLKLAEKFLTGLTEDAYRTIYNDARK